MSQIQRISSRCRICHFSVICYLWRLYRKDFRSFYSLFQKVTILNFGSVKCKPAPLCTLNMLKPSCTKYLSYCHQILHIHRRPPHHLRFSFYKTCQKVQLPAALLTTAQRAVKDLGVTIDCNLKYSKHIDYIVGRVRQRGCPKIFSSQQERALLILFHVLLTLTSAARAVVKALYRNRRRLI